MVFINETDRTSFENEVHISGSVEVIQYHNEENGYTVMKIYPTDGYDGELDIIPVVCTVPSIERGEDVEITGKFINHPKFGLQIKADSIKTVLPDTEYGIKTLLLNGFLPGVGKKTAERMIKAFGKDTFKIIESEPERLKEIKGITPKKIEKILEAYAEKRYLKEVLAYCQGLGIGMSLSAKIFKEYGNNTIKQIKKNPYKLIEDVHGVGFKKADEIAQKNGMDRDSPFRIGAGLEYILTVQGDFGHVWFPRHKLLEEMTKTLGVAPKFSEKVLIEKLEDGSLVENSIGTETCIARKAQYKNERTIAEKLIELRDNCCPSRRLPLAEELEETISDAERHCAITLAESQREAVRMAVNNNVCIITGGPGVGKTTIVKTIITLLHNEGNEVRLAAPTGRASKRMEESTGYRASTIHRLLEVDTNIGRFKHNEKNPLMGDVFILDEVSMVDTSLMSAFLRALPKSASVIFVGDVDQLPSVGAGKVLADMINSGVLPVARLTEIFRQAKTSKIIMNAHRINHGNMPIMENSIDEDFFYVRADEPDTCVNKILQMVMKNIPERWGFDPLRDVQVLCPMKATPMGTMALNNTLQRHLNENVKIGLLQAELKQKTFSELTSEERDFLRKHNEEIPFIHNKFKTFAVGDKVMQTKNNYDKEVFNGDVGYIEYINTKDKIVRIDFNDGDDDRRSVEYKYDELDEVVLAYACTIHKSQGSEYPVVVIPVMNQHFMMLQRKLLYTGVTRGKQIVILVGQQDALQRAVRGKKVEFGRYTKLEEWLVLWGNDKKKMTKENLL